MVIETCDKHVIDEPELEIGKPQSCNVVVNHHVELTEEEKKSAKAQEDKQHQPSLFDNF